MTCEKSAFERLEDARFVAQVPSTIGDSAIWPVVSESQPPPSEPFDIVRRAFRED